MKLWTEMKRDTDGEWFANDPDPNQCKGAIARDAAAAHALMRAIGEFHNAPLDSSLTFPKDAIDWLEVRADEIMAGWGFDTGEIDPPADRRTPEQPE